MSKVKLKLREVVNNSSLPRRFRMKNVVAIAICLAVSVMFAGCKTDDDDEGKDDGWISSEILSEYGLDGLSKPTGASNVVYTNAGGLVITIVFKGNASTAASVKSYFEGNNGWYSAGEIDLGNDRIQYLYIKNKPNGLHFFNAGFAEVENGSFQLISQR